MTADRATARFPSYGAAGFLPASRTFAVPTPTLWYTHPTMHLPTPDDIQLTGDLPQDVTEFLRRHGCPATVDHSQAVAATAAQLAARFAPALAPAAVTAAWLHDVSAVIPNADRLAAAESWGLPVLDAERQAPILLHQKLSARMALDLFGVTDPSILDAIGCHTTLRAQASSLDKIVFLADKLAWDQPGRPPYLASMEAALDVSLDAAVCVYLDHLWARRSTLAAIHPWLVGAHRPLCQPTEAT